MNSVSEIGIALYNTKDGQIHLDVRLQDENIWLNQRQMAELFERSVKTINEHLQNIYEDGELVPEATIRKYRIVQREAAIQAKYRYDIHMLQLVVNFCQKIIKTAT